MECRSIILNVSFKAALADRWEHLDIRCDACDVTVRYGVEALRTRTPHRVVSDLVARMRCRICGTPPSTVYLVKILEDADPLQFLKFRVEEWTDDGQHVEAIKAACSNVTSGWAAYHAIVKDIPNRHLTFRIGTWLFASTRPEPPPSPPSNVVPMPKRSRAPKSRRHRSRIAPF